jgi:site-specific recombinase XerD
MKQTDLAKTITHFFTEFLPGQRNLSSNTIKSYRDTFKLLLYFYEQELNIRPEHLTFADIDCESILRFLNWLEEVRHVSASTRNQRLAAIHSFFRYAQMENPELLLACQRILHIPFKRKLTKTIDYLMPDSLKIMLNQPDISTPKGRRDLTLMALLYDTGARVQEFIDINARDVRITSPAVITLTGKGNKKRYVPIMNKTLKLLKDYMEETGLNDNGKQDHPLFFNSQCHKFSRPGIAYILRKYFMIAKAQNHDIVFPEKLTPHTFRHTKAMHLLDAGVNLIYIRDFLGHVNVTTTEHYARVNSDTKRKALESAYIEITEEVPAWGADKDLLNWLQKLCK